METISGRMEENLIAAVHCGVCQLLTCCWLFWATSLVLFHFFALVKFVASPSTTFLPYLSTYRLHNKVWVVHPESNKATPWHLLKRAMHQKRNIFMRKPWFSFYWPAQSSVASKKCFWSWAYHICPSWLIQMISHSMYSRHWARRFWLSEILQKLCSSMTFAVSECGKEIDITGLLCPLKSVSVPVWMVFSGNLWWNIYLQWSD